jgi:hypothetical protein
MDNKKLAYQVKILCALILLNFLAQILYFFHLYYPTQALDIDIRSFLIMGAVFAPFLFGSILLFRKRPAGYWLLVVFLTAEFLFYLVNTIGSVVHGNGLFFQVRNPDLVLRAVYSIGYMNLFASGYFLFLLIKNKADFVFLSAD